MGFIYDNSVLLVGYSLLAVVYNLTSRFALSACPSDCPLDKSLQNPEILENIEFKESDSETEDNWYRYSLKFIN